MNGRQVAFRVAALFGVVLLWLLAPGCALPWSRSPRQVVQTPGGTRVTQTGDAKAAGNVTTSTTTTELPLPAGTAVAVQAGSDTAPAPAPAGDSTTTPGGPPGAPARPLGQAGALSLVIPSPTTLRTVTTRESVNGPESHPPPSAGELARAAGVKWFYIGGVLCFLAGLVCLKTGHPINAGVCALGAVGLPTLGNLLGSQWALYLAIGVAVAAAALAVAWFHLRKYHPDFIAEAKAKADQVKGKAAAALEEVAAAAGGGSNAKPG